MPEVPSSPPLRRALNQVFAFKYVTEPNAPTYRSIIQVFFEARHRYVIELRGREVLDHLHGSNLHFELDGDEALDRHLAQLVTWGNLAVAQDSGAVSRLEDFYKKRFLYHLTAAGEAAHRAVLEVEATAARSGSLQSTMLAKIRDTLVGLAEHGAVSSPDPDTLFRRFHDLHSAFETLTEEANRFISDLDRTEAGPAHEERFILYKQALLIYISRFIEQLRRLADEIRAAIAAVEAAGSGRLIELASRSGDLPPALGQGEPAAQWRTEQAARWSGIRAWFQGDAAGGTAPTVDRLAEVARDAVVSLTRTLARLNERRTRPVDRAADFRTLARWFSACPDDRAAHVLWRSAFGLSPARHFDLEDEDPELVAPGTSWWEAPGVEVPVRLRTHGAVPTAGRPSAAPDHTLTREWIAQKRRREQAQLQEALRRFSGRGPLTVSSLAALDASEFDTLLSLLDVALTAPRQPDGARAAVTSDGRYRIVLRLPDPKERRHVFVVTPTGRLHCLDYRLELEDASRRRALATGGGAA
jgi:uncharacterized protein (TIGR02677 family)